MRYIDILAENLQGVLRDKHGNPLRLYHGTADAFAKFDPKKVHDKEGISLKLGFGPGVLYFTDHPDDAFRYAVRHSREGVNIHPVFLIMHKPFVIRHWDDNNSAWMRYAVRGYGEYAGIKSYVARMRRFIRDLKAEGYDGIIVSDGKPNPPGEYVAFDPSQVISYLEPRGIEMRNGSSLSEAPIGNLEVHNMDQPGTFPDVDRRLLRNPAHIQKIRKRFEKTPFDFDLYFINQPGRSYLGPLELIDGMDNVPQQTVFNDDWYDDLELTGVVSPEYIKMKFGIAVPPNPNAISVVFASNANDEYSVNMTPWIVAHRFAHALTEYTNNLPDDLQREVRELPQSGATPLHRIFHSYIHLWQLMTSRSARMKVMSPAECIEELIAQYLITGRITLAIPENWRARYGDEVLLKMDQFLARYAKKLAVQIERVLERCVGHIFLSI